MSGFFAESSRGSSVSGSSREARRPPGAASFASCRTATRPFQTTKFPCWYACNVLATRSSRVCSSAPIASSRTSELRSASFAICCRIASSCAQAGDGNKTANRIRLARTKSVRRRLAKRMDLFLPWRAIGCQCPPIPAHQSIFQVSRDRWLLKSNTSAKHTARAAGFIPDFGELSRAAVQRDKLAGSLHQRLLSSH